jgi:branched-chain amino acid transport system substrate-binding protein
MYVAASSGIDASLATVQGIQEGGMVSTQPQPPWFLKTETPAIAAYAEAKRRYAAGSKEGQDVMVGWVAGQMIEKALANVSPLGRAVQPADFLRGLWMFKGETVGGLIPPTTFVQDQPTTDEGNCWYPGSVVNGKWTAPEGAQPTCIPMKLKY